MCLLVLFRALGQLGFCISLSVAVMDGGGAGVGGAFSCFRQSVPLHPFLSSLGPVVCCSWEGLGEWRAEWRMGADDVRCGILNGQVTVPAPLPGGPKVTVVLVKGRRSMAARQSGRVG